MDRRLTSWARAREKRSHREAAKGNRAGQMPVGSARHGALT